MALSREFETQDQVNNSGDMGTVLFPVFSANTMGGISQDKRVIPIAIHDPNYFLDRPKDGGRFFRALPFEIWPK